MYYLAIAVSCLTLIGVLLFLRQWYLERTINNQNFKLEELERTLRLQIARVNTITDIMNKEAADMGSTINNVLLKIQALETLEQQLRKRIEALESVARLIEVSAHVS